MTEQKNTETTSAEEPLTPKKKRAMLEYLAIMFAVAFLLVAVSLLVKVSAMQDDLDAANTGASLNISALEAQVESIGAENSALQTALDDAQRAAKANELLLLSQEADQSGDSIAFHGYMAELEGYSDALSTPALTIYRTLLNHLTKS